MRIEKRNFSSISELEERAFCEGYIYAQREFAEEEDDEESSHGKYKPLAGIGAGASISGFGGYGSYKLSKKAADKLEKAGKLKKSLQELYEADLNRLKKDVLRDAQRGGEVAKMRALESGKGILDLEKSGMLTEAEKERLSYLRNTTEHKRLKTVEGLEKKARDRAKKIGNIGIGLGVVGASALAKGLYDYKNRNKE